MYRSFFKRFFDVIGAAMLLMMLLPVLVIVTLLLAFVNEGKPFFLQLRPGKKQKVFTIIKFRTMNNKKDENGVLLPDKDRITGIGNFIRKYSIDELPQIINVLIGDMSFIGPRPLLTNYIHLYNSFQNRRHELRPGITGLAQVKGRNSISWNNKFKYDVWYVDNVSFKLDVKILFLTFLKVIKSDGINSDENITMEPFEGKY